MKKIILALFLTAMVCCLAACGSFAGITPGKYTVENSENTLSPSLELSADGSFVLFCSPLSSTIPMGNYTVSDNTLTLTDNADNVYVFTVKDGALIFRQDDSADIPRLSDNDLSDGDVFFLTDKEEKIS